MGQNAAANPIKSTDQNKSGPEGEGKSKSVGQGSNQQGARSEQGSNQQGARSGQGSTQQGARSEQGSNQQGSRSDQGSTKNTDYEQSGRGSNFKSKAEDHGSPQQTPIKADRASGIKDDELKEYSEESK